MLRPPEPEDRAALAVRDEQHVRFMGDADPDPIFAVTVDGAIVGWVDFDRGERTWLDDSQVNIGYSIQPEHRGQGYATRAVQLLVHHLAQETDVRTATLLISPENTSSLAIAARAGFDDRGTLGDEGARFFEKPIPPLTYTDGVVTIRPHVLRDLDRHLEAKDATHMEWIWGPGERAAWDATSPDEQRAKARLEIESHLADPRNGPKWSFVIDVDGQCVGEVACDLANRNVPHGEANIGYWAHPAERGKGYVSRAVRLSVQFLRDHTGAREAHIGVDVRNEASLRVARAVGAVEVRRSTDDLGRTGVHHRIDITR